MKACLQKLSAVVGTYTQNRFAIHALGQSSLKIFLLKGWNKGHTTFWRMDLLQTSDGMGNGRVYSGGPVRNSLSPDRDEDTLHTHYRRFPFLPVLPEVGGRSSLGVIVGILAWDNGPCPEFQLWPGQPALPFWKSKYWWQEHVVCCLKRSWGINWIWRMDGICGWLILKLALVINT